MSGLGLSIFGIDSCPSADVIGAAAMVVRIALRVRSKTRAALLR